MCARHCAQIFTRTFSLYFHNNHMFYYYSIPLKYSSERKGRAPLSPEGLDPMAPHLPWEQEVLPPSPQSTAQRALQGRLQPGREGSPARSSSTCIS